jgi:hypothetical protein
MRDLAVRFLHPLATVARLTGHGEEVNARITKDPSRYGFTLFGRNYLDCFLDPFDPPQVRYWMALAL